MCGWRIYPNTMVELSEQEAVEVKRVSANEKGRAYLGSDYGGATVEIAVLSVLDEESENKEGE